MEKCRRREGWQPLRLVIFVTPYAVVPRTQGTRNTETQAVAGSLKLVPRAGVLHLVCPHIGQCPFTLRLSLRVGLCSPEHTGPGKTKVWALGTPSVTVTLILHRKGTEFSCGLQMFAAKEK